MSMKNPREIICDYYSFNDTFQIIRNIALSYRSKFDYIICIWAENDVLPVFFVNLLKTKYRTFNISEEYKFMPEIKKSTIEYKNVLILFDILNQDTIKHFKGIRSYINDKYSKISIGAIFSEVKYANIIDICFTEVTDNTYYEWNLIETMNLANCCVDLDGIFCRDPTAHENDDGIKYLHFIKNITPFRLPSSKIGWIVTSRLDKYRELTIHWLVSHGIKFNELIMLDYTSAKERRALNTNAEYKSLVYKKTNAKLFIESSIIQARKINTLTGLPVFCCDNGEYYKRIFNKNYVNSTNIPISIEKR